MSVTRGLLPRLMSVAVVAVGLVAGMAPARAQSGTDIERSLNVDEKKLVQEGLIWLGAYNGWANGIMGDATRTAIAAWQEKIGARASGQLDEEQVLKLAGTAFGMRDETGWDVLADSRSRITMSYPAKLFTERSDSDQGGIIVATPDGTASLMTLRFTGTTAGQIDSFYDSVATGDGVQVTYEFRKPTLFIVTGIRNKNKFYARFEERGSEVRGYDFVWTPDRSTDMEPISVLLSNSFFPFGYDTPQADPTYPTLMALVDARKAQDQGRAASQAGAAPAQSAGASPPQQGSPKRGRFGVEIQEVTAETAKSLGLPTATGALVTGVQQDTPAQEAGLQKGDLILSFDGRQVATIEGLVQMIGEAEAGKTVSLLVLRDGRKGTLSATMPGAPQQASTEGTPKAQSNSAPSNNTPPASGRTVAGGNFTFDYLPPDSQGLQEAYEFTRDTDLLGENPEIQAMNGMFALPRPLHYIGAECGAVNAFYSPKDSAVILCYEMVADIVTQAHKLAEGTSPDENVLGGYIASNIRFILLHETGHALIDLLDLPAVGREEDSVDQMAAVMLLLNAGGTEGPDKIGRVLQLASVWFRVQTSSDSEGKVSMETFADEHSLSEQRYFNLLCMMFGHDPRSYSWVLEKGLLPEARAARCQNESDKIFKAWGALLSPHFSPSFRLARQLAQ
jgi:hypothetical protein